MARLDAVSVTQSATTVTAAAATVSNTIAQADIGTRGALLNVINGGGSPVTMTLADPGKTPAGNSGVAAGQSIAASADKWVWVGPQLVDPATGVATVTLSSATSVTYKLLRL